MSRLEEIEHAVEQLSPVDFATFRAWFEEMQARRFDERVEFDMKNGKLDWLAEEALAEHAAGKTHRYE